MSEHPETYTAPIPKASAPPIDYAVASRLLAAARDLLAQELPLCAVETRIFAALAPPPDANSSTANRARLFRTMMIGLPSPLPKSEASAVTDAIMRALRGPADPDFSQSMIRARLLGSLLQAVFDAAEDARRERIGITRENLRTAVAFAVLYARPRSDLVPWHVDNSAVDAMLEVALDDYLGSQQ